MKILFDANTPSGLRRFLRNHDVVRADELGWQRLQNGRLLSAAEEAGFDVLVTCDQNIQHQHSFQGRRMAIVVLSSNRWKTLRPAGAKVAIQVDFVQAGQVLFIDVAAL